MVLRWTGSIYETPKEIREFSSEKLETNLNKTKFFELFKLSEIVS